MTFPYIDIEIQFSIKFKYYKGVFILAYNCDNPYIDDTCGNYIKYYLGNLEYVSKGLLGIINEHILPDETSMAPYPIANDNCQCDSGLLPTGETHVFNCPLWTIIKNHLIVVSSDSTDVQGYLPVLCMTIKCYLEHTSNINHGFAAQLERLYCLCESLETRLDSVSCNNKCPDIIGDLLCLLMQILTKLISTVAKVSTLIYYSGCDTNPATGRRVVTSFFECMVCDFVNDLCELEKLIPELSSIVVGFATCDIQSCTPCYTAPSAPRKVRPICPSNMMNTGNYGSNNNYSGGCSCKKR